MKQTNIYDFVKRSKKKPRYTKPFKFKKNECSSCDTSDRPRVPDRYRDKNKRSSR